MENQCGLPLPSAGIFHVICARDSNKDILDEAYKPVQ